MISLDYHGLDCPEVIRFRTLLKRSSGTSAEAAHGFLLRCLLYFDLQGRIPIECDVVEDASGWTVPGLETGRKEGDFIIAATQSGILRYEEEPLVSVADWSLWTQGLIVSYGPEWPRAKRAAMERDGRRCQMCDATKRLHVHHMTPIRAFFGNTKAANDLSNLITLCWKCHAEADANRRAKER